MTIGHEHFTARHETRTIQKRPARQHLSLEEERIQHQKQLIEHFGMSEGLLIVVLEEEYRLKRANSESWLPISTARWIQQAAMHNGGKPALISLRLRRHLMSLSRQGIIERQYRKKNEMFVFRLNRETLEKQLRTQKCAGKA